MKKAVQIIAYFFTLVFVNAQNLSLEWAKDIGGSQTTGYSIAVDASGNVYTTGFFWQTTDFDPGIGVFNLTSAQYGYDIFISKLDAHGNFVWAKKMGGGAYDDGLSIAVDSSGNVYTTGHFYGTADFDPGKGVFILPWADKDDIFISKLGSNGDFIWAKSMGGNSSDYGWSLAVDASGNVYTTGHFIGTVDFDPSAATFNLVSNGNADIFVSKLDTDGKLEWAKNIGGPSTEDGLSIAVDKSGNVYTTGLFYGTVDFDPNIGINDLSSGAGDDIYISKLDTDGNFIWAKNIGGNKDDTGLSLTVDALGNVYTTGSFEGTADFDPD